MKNINVKHQQNKADFNLSHQLTLISVGAMAYIFADVIHEAIGHGLTSLILGNKITLLTSVYFRSEPHSFITDAFGPILNLIAGLTIWIILKNVNFLSLYIKLLLLLTMAFNFFWFSWMCVYCGITNTGDFAFYISGQAALTVWRLFLILTGLTSYYLTFTATAKTGFQNLAAGTNERQLFLIPYLSAGITALIAVSFYRPLSFDNFYEAFMFPIFLPTLFLSRPTNNKVTIDKLFSLTHEKPLILSAMALFILFCWMMGQGLKF